MGTPKPLTREELQRELEDLMASRPPPTPSTAAASRQGSGALSRQNSGALTRQTSGALSRQATGGAVAAASSCDTAKANVPTSSSTCASLGGRDESAPPPTDSTPTISTMGRSWVADAARLSAGDGVRRAKREGLRGWWGALRASMHVDVKGINRALRRHPATWIIALLTTALLAAAGITSVVAAARSETQHRLQAARGAADAAAVGLEVQIQALLSPMMALAAFVHDMPAYPRLAARFPQISQELLAVLPTSNAVSVLQLIPQGVVRTSYPVKGNEGAMGHDLLRDPARRDAALETIASGRLTLQGPVELKQGGLGLISRLPLFIEGAQPGDTFGAPGSAFNCTPCSRPGRAFWGFVACILDFEKVINGTDSRIKSLESQGYEFALYAPQPSGATLLVAHSPVFPSASDSVTATVAVPNSNWTLAVRPARGWVPAWRGIVIGITLIASSCIGLLVCAVLISRRQQAWLLKEMQSANHALAAEKERMDVLLARQYNLIQCVLESGGVAMGASSESNSRSRSIQEKTLERIEDMRRSVGSSVAGSGVDEIKLKDLLGEGTFGKVYKGVWRGTTVAVKTMVLPANMSGAEKRERMAIMEMAISSAITHPNIVATYTYTIRPTRHSNLPEGVRLSHVSAPHSLENGLTSSQSLDVAHDNGRHVHSFEVSLVLEFCDWGCLRDALDAGAFYTANNALNYAAILDTAADIARAMLHLHRNKVIHADLKVRNVLLKSEGSSGRKAIAKVADFGLAVRVDAADTHVTAFQGTLNHMAPEAQLGRLSMAGDVYSFGITMYEMYTGDHAFADVPRALLGHKVAVEGLRPRFPPFAPAEYRALAEACWAHEPSKRPTFDSILATLQAMRDRLSSAPTPPLTPYAVAPRPVDPRDVAQQMRPGGFAPQVQPRAPAGLHNGGPFAAAAAGTGFVATAAAGWPPTGGVGDSCSGASAFAAAELGGSHPLNFGSGTGGSGSIAEGIERLVQMGSFSYYLRDDEDCSIEGGSATGEPPSGPPAWQGATVPPASPPRGPAAQQQQQPHQQQANARRAGHKQQHVAPPPPLPPLPPGAPRGWGSSGQRRHRHKRAPPSVLTPIEDIEGGTGPLPSPNATTSSAAGDHMPADTAFDGGGGGGTDGGGTDGDASSYWNEGSTSTGGTAESFSDAGLVPNGGISTGGGAAAPFALLGNGQQQRAGLGPPGR